MVELSGSLKVGVLRKLWMADTQAVWSAGVQGEGPALKASMDWMAPSTSMVGGELLGAGDGSARPGLLTSLVRRPTVAGSGCGWISFASCLKLPTVPVAKRQ